jgi:SAM-dependent methyltransferase
MFTYYPGIIGPVSDKDLMFNRRRANAAEHYTSVGESAIANINQSLADTGRDWSSVVKCLDMASGYGRVLRHLVRILGAEKVTACDNNGDALAFCASQFKVKTIPSTDFSALALGGKFDLIWVGSLFTHLPEHHATPLMWALAQHLAEAGTLVITTHGDRCATREGLKRYKTPPEIASSSQQYAQRFEEAGGYLFVLYAGRTDYGISFFGEAWMRTWLRQFNSLHVTRFERQGWYDHQDVWTLTSA